MIKLDRTDKPEYLSDAKVQELTEEYRLDNKKNVWNKPQIKNALLALSGNKCAYCEAKLQIEDSFIEVEHFHPKSSYPEEVVLWDNLLPSCKACNGNKGSHDTVNNPIIDPTVIEPKDHLCVEAARLYSKSLLGQDTIDVLDLNDIDRLISSRSDVFNCLKETLDNLYRLDKIDSRYRNKLKGVLSACLADKAFSGMTSNVIQNDPYYHEMKQKLIDNNLWSNELEDLDNQTKKLALPSR